MSRLSSVANFSDSSTPSSQLKRRVFSHTLAAFCLANMAPSFDQLSDHDFQEEDDEIDFSDLQERYDVRMEEGLDTFVVRRSIPNLLPADV